MILLLTISAWFDGHYPLLRKTKSIKNFYSKFECLSFTCPYAITHDWITYVGCRDWAGTDFHERCGSLPYLHKHNEQNMLFSELAKEKYVFSVLTVFTLRHILYNPWINNGKKYHPVLPNTWMNAIFWNVCIAPPNSLYSLPWHRHIYVKMMNRLLNMHKAVC